MRICQYIGELLFLHDCVVVPGLGGFVTNYSPAKINPYLHSFSPPRKEILFNVMLSANDGVLAHYMAGKENITYEEALKQIRAFADEILAAIEKGPNAEIVRVGILHRDSEGNLRFEPSRDINYLLSSFGLAPFVSPAIHHHRLQLRREKQSQRRPATVRHNRRLPVALKRSIWIGLPFAVLIIAGVMGFGTLKNIYTQYADLIPRILHDKSEEVKNSGTAEKKVPDAVQKRETYFVEPAAKNIVPEKVQTTVQESPAGSMNSIPIAEGRFYIIGNCFQSEQNAMNYVGDLKAKGYTSAGYFLPPQKKLFRAYFSSHATRQEAEEAMNTIRNKETPDAWLLEF